MSPGPAGGRGSPLTTGLRGADVDERETLAARIQSTPLPLGARTSGGRRAVSVDTATARAAAAHLPRALPPTDGAGGAGAARPAGAARAGAPPLAPGGGPGSGARPPHAAPTAPLVVLPSPFVEASGCSGRPDAGAEPEPLPQSSAARTSYAWLGQAPGGADADAAAGGPDAGRAPPWPPERGAPPRRPTPDPPKAPESVASAGGGGGGGLREVLGACAAVVFALFCSGVYFVLAFPFFTYVPSSGGIGARLPLAKARRVPRWSPGRRAGRAAHPRGCLGSSCSHAVTSCTAETRLAGLLGLLMQPAEQAHEAAPSCAAANRHLYGGLSKRGAHRDAAPRAGALLRTAACGRDNRVSVTPTEGALKRGAPRNAAGALLRAAVCRRDGARGAAAAPPGAHLAGAAGRAGRGHGRHAARLLPVHPGRPQVAQRHGGRGCAPRAPCAARLRRRLALCGAASTRLPG